jgi:ubiquinone/menaquinone biosynthesis C-methylase UbiE
MQLDEEAAPYDPTSPETDFDWWYAQFDIDVLERFLIGEKVIELGCGKGNVTEKLAQKCQKLIVVDAAEANIAITSNRLKERSNVEFCNSLWQDFDYAAADISDIVFFMGLQYLDHEETLLVLRKIRHFLTPQGRLHVVVPNAKSLHRRIAYCMNLIKDVHELSERNQLLGHARVYDKEMLFDELKECSFDVLHWEGIFLKPLPNDMMASLDKRVIYGLYEIGRELPDYCAHIYTLCKKSVGFFDLDQALVDTSARQ